KPQATCAYCDTASAILSQNFAALYLCFGGFGFVNSDCVNLFSHGMSTAPQWFVIAATSAGFVPARSPRASGLRARNSGLKRKSPSRGASLKRPLKFVMELRGN